MSRLRVVKRDQIWVPGNNPRQNIPEHVIAERRESIRQHGILQPLGVTEEPSRVDGRPYKLNWGFIRYFASEGVADELPVVVVDRSRGTFTELALIENIQRTDMAPIDEAAAVVELMGEASLSISQVARRLGKSEGWVNNRLALLRTGSDVQEVAAVVPDAMSSLLLIDKVQDGESRDELLTRVMDGAPHADIRAAVQSIASESPSPAPTAPDRETAARAADNAATGGGNMSRGQQVTGPSQREANTEVSRAIKTLEAWAEHCSDAQFKRLEAFARRVIRGDLSR